MGYLIFFENGSIRIVEESPSQKRYRPGRGKSLLCLLEDYTSLDLETTGFSPEYCEIIEVACIRYRGGNEVGTFSSLVKPQDMDAVDSYITNLTGITPEMLKDAPAIETVLPQLLEFVGDDTIVGHKASFDINFVYDNAERLGLGVFGNDYIDTMRLSRRLFPDFINHKLKTLVKKFGISDKVDHRAESDARQAAGCYQYMVKYTIENGLADKLSAVQSSGRRPVKAADIVGNPELLKENSPLYGKTVVFTGTLERMTRKEAMQVVADLGGINGDNVTKKTDFLVLGNNDMCASIKDGKSSKHKKAEKYILAGSDMSIISENVFYDMLSEGCEEIETNPDQPEKEANLATVPRIPCYGVELSKFEADFVDKIASILQHHPAYSSLVIERRSKDYLGVVIGWNDFMRFKYSDRAKWVSLDLPKDIADANRDNPIFAAQRNKAQRHWKAYISSLDDLDGLAPFITASCIDDYSWE